MTTLQQVADYFKANMDFGRFARLTYALGNQVNDQQLRFIKALIFESSIEEYSQGLIQYVGQDGCDLVIPVLPARVEMKYVETALFTTSKKQLRENTGGIKLMNSMGTNTHKVLPSHYADFLLVVGRQGAALFDRTTVEQHIDPGGDGITANIRVNKGIVIATPDDMKQDNQQEVDFVLLLKQMIKSYIQSIK
jgi:hypothetical protein